MRADPEEHLNPNSGRDRFPIVPLLLALAVIAGLVYYWFWEEGKKPVESLIQIPSIAVPAPETELPPTPDIPQRSEPAPVVAPVVAPDISAVTEETETPVEQTGPAPAAPLTPDEGNELLLRQLAATGADSSLNKLMSNEHPLDVSAALIDGLGRGLILRNIFTVSSPGQAFSVVREGGVIYMEPVSYERYNKLADTISSLDSDSLVDTFHTLRPLYEGVYKKLGLDPSDFDNAIIRILDLVLATPEIAEPIALKPKSVMYIYADPALESLPSVQKQLLRMGPDNIRRIKQQAQILRDNLLAQ